MWLLVSPSSAQKIWLRPGLTVSIGRKGTDIVLSNRTISRLHASFSVAVINQSPQAGSIATYPTVTITDIGSKYGTFVGSKSQKVNGTMEVCDGQSIRFGSPSDHAIFRLIRIPIVVCTSGLKSQMRANISTLASEYDIAVTTQFSPKCTHLLMDYINITAKVVQALATATPIVSAAWIKAFSNVNAMDFKAPEPNDFLPPHDKLPWPDVSFLSNERRKTLFSGIDFIVFSQEEVKSVEAVVIASGGRIKIFPIIDPSQPTFSEMASLKTLIEMTPRPIVVFPKDPNISQLIQPLYTELERIECTKAIMTHDQIALAIVYISVDYATENIQSPMNVPARACQNSDNATTSLVGGAIGESVLQTVLSRRNSEMVQELQKNMDGISDCVISSINESIELSNTRDICFNNGPQEPIGTRGPADLVASASHNSQSIHHTLTRIGSPQLEEQLDPVLQSVISPSLEKQMTTRHPPEKTLCKNIASDRHTRLQSKKHTTSIKKPLPTVASLEVIPPSALSGKMAKSSRLIDELAPSIQVQEETHSTDAISKLNNSSNITPKTTTTALFSGAPAGNVDDLMDFLLESSTSCTTRAKVNVPIQCEVEKCMNSVSQADVISHHTDRPEPHLQSSDPLNTPQLDQSIAIATSVSGTNELPHTTGLEIDPMNHGASEKAQDDQVSYKQTFATRRGADLVMDLFDDGLSDFVPVKAQKSSGMIRNVQAGSTTENSQGHTGGLGISKFLIFEDLPSGNPQENEQPQSPHQILDLESENATVFDKHITPQHLQSETNDTHMYSLEPCPTSNQNRTLSGKRKASPSTTVFHTSKQIKESHHRMTSYPHSTTLSSHSASHPIITASPPKPSLRLLSEKGIRTIVSDTTRELKEIKAEQQRLDHQPATLVSSRNASSTAADELLVIVEFDVDRKCVDRHQSSRTKVGPCLDTTTEPLIPPTDFKRFRGKDKAKMLGYSTNRRTNILDLYVD
ncbi:hypothetical protein BASA61_005003 [Batrachochytrium salamandrivorans]|nr:hypothetical protein BASA61_005003 [Batrachochytrium salamandrivorans]